MIPITDFINFAHLKSIHIDCVLRGDYGSYLADDLYEVSQHFANVRRRPLESIRLSGACNYPRNYFETAASFHRLFRIPELIELSVQIGVSITNDLL